MNSHAATPSPAVLAGMLIAHVQSAGLFNTEALSRDPITALSADPGVRIVWVEPAGLPAGCSIAAACDKSSEPARLLISRDSSVGRRRFSVLHEYGHLLRDLVPAVLEALFASPDAGAALEERMCDEFASRVLLPDTLLDSVLRFICYSPSRSLPYGCCTGFGRSMRRRRGAQAPSTRVCNAAVPRRESQLHSPQWRCLLRAARCGTSRSPRASSSWPPYPRTRTGPLQQRQPGPGNVRRCCHRKRPYCCRSSN